MTHPPHSSMLSPCPASSKHHRSGTARRDTTMGWGGRFLRVTSGFRVGVARSLCAIRRLAVVIGLGVSISVGGAVSAMGREPLGESRAAAPLFLAQGTMSGEVTATTVLLQTRLTADPGPGLNQQHDIDGAIGYVRFAYGPAEEISANDQADAADETQDPLAWQRSARLTEWQAVDAEHDFIVRVELTDLQPATRYLYRAIFTADKDVLDDDSVSIGEAASFLTLPEPRSGASVRFCMGSCMNYHSFMSGVANGGGPVTATEEDRLLGYPVFEALRDLEPDFFIGTGDIVYYDHPAQTAARTLPELRRKWHEQFRFPRLKEFFERTPVYWSKDDHDFRFNDADLMGAREPSAVVGIDLFREQLPLLPADDHDSPSYRTHRINRHVQLWFVEGRDYRSPNREPDGPEKTIWGAEQKQWLQETLRASDATWKIIITPTPMVGPDRASKRDNHTNPEGFRHEADEFFAWLKAEGIDNVLTCCGDRHWQYHSVHPLGVEEFCCGALNDENSIRGVRPGANGSTDPEGLIEQPYLYSEPTGGFLEIAVEERLGNAVLTFRFHDDHGVVLYETNKQSPLD